MINDMAGRGLWNADIADETPCARASLVFLKDVPAHAHEKPFHYTGPLEPSREHLRSNIKYETCTDVLLRNLRPRMHCLTIEDHGIQFVRSESAHLQALSDPDGRNAYLSETASLIRQVMQADLVITFTVRFRKSNPTTDTLADNNNSLTAQAIVGTADSPDGPVWAVHVDETPASGQNRLRLSMNAAERVRYPPSKYRIREVNAWRPLRGPVRDAPLAFCDPATLSPADMVDVDRPSANQTSEAIYIKYNSNHQWCYLQDQMPDELSLFLSWDSEPGLGPPCMSLLYSVTE